MPADIYQKLTLRQQLETLDEVSRRLGISAAIVEKDYWVCRTLDILFTLPGLKDHLVFKGGTSLSKVYRLIERFSEDIDVSFHRDFLGIGEENDPEKAEGKERRRRLENLQKVCTGRIADTLLPALHRELENQLGADSGWRLEIAGYDPQTVLFHFPKAGTGDHPYIPPRVVIELGARSDNWPREERGILSFIGETLNLPVGAATVQALGAERTFWEKATLLHAEHHRPLEAALPQRHARHFHDLARLAVSPVAETALQNEVLRRRVVEHKSAYFRSGWSRYDLAQPGTFKLVPPPERLEALAADHESMREMFFRSPPSIEEVLGILSELEGKINALRP